MNIKELSPTGKVLVVGGRLTNLQPEFRDHPRVIFWGCLNHNVNKKTIPVGVEIILFFRFIKHKHLEKVEKLAIQSGVYFDYRYRNTGEMNRLLRQLLNEPAEPPKKEAPVEQVETKQIPEKTALPPQTTTETKTEEGETTEKATTEKKAERGLVTRFVKENARLEDPPTAEIRRLFQLLREQGVAATESAVSAAFYKLKKEKNAPNSLAKIKRRPDSIKELGEFIEASPRLVDLFSTIPVAIMEILEENRKLAELNKALEQENLSLKKELQNMRDIKSLIEKMKSL
jgi:hypothetical protein